MKKLINKTNIQFILISVIYILLMILFRLFLVKPTIIIKLIVTMIIIIGFFASYFFLQKNKNVFSEYKTNSKIILATILFLAASSCANYVTYATYYVFPFSILVSYGALLLSFCLVIIGSLINNALFAKKVFSLLSLYVLVLTNFLLIINLYFPFVQLG